MRIVIAEPPKAGNVWLKCLLASTYDLQALGPKRSPERPTLDAFQTWVGQDQFKDGTVFHQHYNYSVELADAIAAVPAHIVTIVRDPYDMFVSSFSTIQKYADGPRAKRRKVDILGGKPLDHPDVIAWLQRGGFENSLVKASQWVGSGRTSVIHYEALMADPLAELTRLSERIEAASPERIAGAVEGCSADSMRQNSRTAGHVRVAKVGDSRARLTASHLEIFHDRYAELIRSLGYDVRDPASTS